MTKTASTSAPKYNDRDVLKVKVVPHIRNYVLENYEGDAPFILKDREENVIEILALQLPKLLKDLEEDAEGWERAKRKYDIALETWVTQETMRIQEDDPSVEVNRHTLVQEFRLNNNHPAIYFFEDNRRSLKSLQTVEVLENLGPRANDLEMRVNEDRELNNLFKKFMMEQMLKGKKDI